ncbi:MAG: PD-(D/E)XK nuclease family protein [Candidatus Nanoarchaeia archaeon]|jgi:CRISPR/Cas system-associated exonuclease Cas4 (RecB family)|nr:PD-(D/E)XK nuclease family protein [Candidatus Nanoarchaeia archaeon]
MRTQVTVSASSLSSFFRCSQMYKWQFLDERTPDEAYLFTTFGSTLHKALELHFKFGLSLDEISAAWPSLFIAFCTEAKNLPFPNSKELEDSIAKGRLQIENVKKMKSRWSSFKILEIEKYCKIPFINHFLDDVHLTGRIDMLLANDEIVCLDWKTSKSKEKEIDKNIQLTFYSFFVRELYKYSLDSIHGALAYPIDGEILFTQRTEEDFEILFRQVNNMLERISKKDFLKEPKFNQRTKDCFFCQYKKTCAKNDDREL